MKNYNFSAMIQKPYKAIYNYITLGECDLISENFDEPDFKTALNETNKTGLVNFFRCCAAIVGYLRSKIYEYVCVFRRY